MIKKDIDRPFDIKTEWARNTDTAHRKFGRPAGDFQRGRGAHTGILRGTRPLKYGIRWRGDRYSPDPRPRFAGNYLWGDIPHCSHLPANGRGEIYPHFEKRPHFAAGGCRPATTGGGAGRASSIRPNRAYFRRADRLGAHSSELIITRYYLPVRQKAGPSEGDVQKRNRPLRRA